ncbi:MAG: A/G-specific adenine glycosylase [Chloroflexi bacterium]|nr:A/G-specific adenine glycosylase [Chloroflexota bacterium]
MIERNFSQILLSWYSKHARELPWRGHPDPYAILVSEMMLQQTRVETVIPYFKKWMTIFPSLHDLANSNEQKVLQVWEGLGYYSRARNLYKTAVMIRGKFDGKLPQTVTELITLPGVGRYTAAAISSIAFGRNEAVLDGNVKRVLARVSNFTQPVNSPEGETNLWDLAVELLPHGKAGAYNQALMDLGATLCTPKSPHCGTCPVNSLCLAKKMGSQDSLPKMLKKSPIPHITVCAAIIHRNDKVLVACRPSKGLLGGLWEFPGGKLEKNESLEQALTREIREELAAEITIGFFVGKYHHTYTHFKVTLHAFQATIAGNEPSPVEASEIRWVSITDLSNFPMGKIDRSISLDLQKQILPSIQ